MSTARSLKSLPVEDYLNGELQSETKYEYVDGRVYAMTGGTNVHNHIATRVLGSLYQQLADSPCEPLNSDTKVRVQRREKTYFYYPDVSVVCQSNPDNDSDQDQPVVIVEVVSESTRRLDESEKRENYLTIPSLRVLVLLEQERCAARTYVRGHDGKFREKLYAEADSIVALESIGVELQFSHIYAGIEFPLSE